jgi:hypothetical protein
MCAETLEDRIREALAESLTADKLAELERLNGDYSEIHDLDNPDSPPMIIYR